MKTLFMVSGGIEAVPGIVAAREMGLHVVVSDGNPTAPGFEYADDTIVASTYDSEATRLNAESYHSNCRRIDGVISVAADVPVTVATVAEALGLPGISVKAAGLTSDKYAMKQRLSECGIPVPWFTLVQDVDHLRSLVMQPGRTLIIKPVDSRGARGVIRLTEDVDLNWAFTQALSQSPSGRIIAEVFIEGQQISTESILCESGSVTPGFSDRNYEYLDRFSPFIIENGGTQPSSLSPLQQRRISSLVIRAAHALGITRGTIKGDMVLSSEGPMVIEIAPRLSGGWFCTDQIPLATGVDIVGAAIRLALGEEINLDKIQVKNHCGVAIRYVFPPAGIVTSVGDFEKYEGLPWVHLLKVDVVKGDTIDAVTDHTKRAGFVICSGADRKEASERACSIAKIITDLIRIER